MKTAPAAGQYEDAPIPLQSAGTSAANPFGRTALLTACDIEFGEEVVELAQQLADIGSVSGLHWNGNNTLTAVVTEGSAAIDSPAPDDPADDEPSVEERAFDEPRVYGPAVDASAYDRLIEPEADDSTDADYQGGAADGVSESSDTYRHDVELAAAVKPYIGALNAEPANVQSVDKPGAHAAAVENVTDQQPAGFVDGLRHEQQIIITRGRENLSLRGSCTCDERRNCYHVAAAILAWISEDEAQLRDPEAVDVWMEAMESATRREEYTGADQQMAVLYRIRQVQTQMDCRYEVAVYSARRMRSGELGKSSPLSLNRRHFDSSDLSAHDSRICNALIGLKDSADGLTLSGENGYMILRWMVESRNCYYEGLDRQALTLAENRTIELEWIDMPDAQRSLRMSLAACGEPFVCLPTEPPWYILPRAAQVGVIDTDIPPPLLARLPFLPPVSASSSMLLSELMVQKLECVDLPLPATIDVRQISGATPNGVIVLSARKDGEGTHRYAEVLVEYDGARLPHMFALKDGREMLHRLDDGGFVRVVRDSDREIVLDSQLKGAGLPKWASIQEIGGNYRLLVNAESTRDTILWQELIDGRLAELRRMGWVIERRPEFEYRVVTSDQWQMHIDHSAEHRWFDLDLNFLVDGKPFALIPVLASFLERVGSDLQEYLADPESTANVWLDEETLVEFPIAHIRPILEVLVELQDHEDGKLRFSELQATVINDIAAGIQQSGVINLDWAVPARLATVLERLHSFGGVQKVELPTGLTAELRDYQRDGLDWLQFLREFGFCGILADDMGLGKTVQALATLLVEKQSGRKQGPSLVVAPTSLMGNWRREAEKFAPDLKVLLLHGVDRAEHFESIQSNDLILTTYALVSRDQDIHLGVEYHYLILDEAQAIKNPATKQAKVVCALRANHKLCLTGTPVENHLGEVWSQFRFLMPGFFGEQKRFNRVFRNPIEKSSETLPSIALQKRLRPFILRRSKDAVASELPAKSEIIQRIALHPEQAVLYEGIRASMEVRVRRALQESGLGQSQITVLDALLRLRQTCLDPRLVKMTQARFVQHSAKLDALMDMLPNFVEEGRRVLLFSQFTEMLGHIETEVAKAGISYTVLTGKTRKRDEAIDEFQSGDASVFLISLKAGGTGLNLTTADTVILYDPWWNPAVENQAIDRAHRIGQDKPVFVYRLITEQTVEEKILDLQQRKKALADLVTENTENSFQSLKADDILELFS